MSRVTLVAVSLALGRTQDVTDALARAARARDGGADLVEWRLDAIADEPGGTEAALRLCRESPLPCIVTVRSHDEGGLYEGDEAQRLALLDAVGRGDHPPAYIDFEFASMRVSANRRLKLMLAVDHPGPIRTGEPRLILSSHDFATRPPNLLQTIVAMWADEACTVAKIAWRGRSLRDNLEVFDILADRLKPTIALCMGEFGLPSRVLAGKFGGFLTFARGDDEPGTAPGQPGLAELLQHYRFRSITECTSVYGVVGWPLGHSHSPRLHNAAFESSGHDGVYLPLPIPPEWEHFKATVGSFIAQRRLNFRGASVTAPHKEHLARFVSEHGGTLDEMTTICGAANTLVVEESGALRAHNTDAPAVLDCLAPMLGRTSDDLRGVRALVLGAGGAGRSAAAALAQAGAVVCMANRTRSRAEAVAAALDGRPGTHGEMRVSAVEWTNAANCACFQCIVNCTVLGMAGGPAPDESPLEDDAPLDGVVVFDSVYAPRLTPLVRQAQLRGAKVVEGLAMFAAQAERQFALWTGQAPPRGQFAEQLARLCR